MDKFLLTIFLVFSLTTQAPVFGTQINHDHAVAGLRQSAAAAQAPYNTDFDDDQRGSRGPALALVKLSAPCGNQPELACCSDTLIDFCLARLPLFKLHAALRI